MTSTTDTEFIIRPEASTDAVAIHAVTSAAFGQANEADLVDALRRDARPFVSLVADRGGAILGHICFSPVSIGGADAERSGALGLGPMAVLPGFQNHGIGSALVHRGFAECRRLNRDVVVVVGHADYYPRFGFRPASLYGMTCEYLVPDDVFMALELRPGALASLGGGLVRYDGAFAMA
jgi:putative acetyltransferase